MKVLVTGANGFVGGAVCRRLLAEGWQVFGSVRRQVTLPAGVDARPIAGIGPDTSWRDALAGIDAVVHLAARVHVMQESATDPLAEFRRTNTAGTLHLAQQAAAMGIPRFVFMSSVKVNGETTPSHPFRADDPPAPLDPYGQSKWEAEQGLQGLAPKGPMRTTILRPPLVYGPGVGGNMRTLLNAVARGWPLPVGAIDNRRSLIYVDNLADAVATVLREPAEACETFLLRDGEDISTAELVRRLARLLDRNPRLLPVPPSLLRLAGSLIGKRPAIDRLTGSLTVDDSTIRSRFGWTPPHALNTGLAEMTSWYLAGQPSRE